MLNHVQLIGNLGADPEVRYTQGGIAVATLRVATTEKWKDKGGEAQERTEWHRVVVWDKLAEVCGEHLGKGRKVFVSGRIQTKTWEDKDKQTRYTTEVVADKVLFLDFAKDDTAPQGKGGKPQGKGGKPQGKGGKPQGKGGKPQGRRDEPDDETPPDDDDIPF